MQFKFIQHSQLDESILNSIILLKNSVWKYSYAEHLDWIKNNIAESDVHLLLWKEKELIGYLNLVRLSGEIEGWGIGNVIIQPKSQGKKIGLLLMNLCDYYLAVTNLPGVLICKNHVLEFYIRCGWKVYSNDVFYNNKKISHNVLTRRLTNSSTSLINLSRIF